MRNTRYTKRPGLGMMRHEITIVRKRMRGHSGDSDFIDTEHITDYTCAAAFEPFRGSLQFDGNLGNLLRVVTHRFKIRTPEDMTILMAQNLIYYNGKIFEIVEHEPIDDLDEYRLVSTRIKGDIGNAGAE